MSLDLITLAAVQPADVADFKTELQIAFAVAVVDEFGALPDGPIPSDNGNECHKCGVPPHSL